MGLWGRSKEAWALTMPTLQESATRLSRRFPVTLNQQNVTFESPNKGKILFSTFEAGMCMKTLETWTI
jgi:hypothetical protein